MKISVASTRNYFGGDAAGGPLALPPRVAAFILAGGRSARFGMDKAFATWEGRAFLACVAEAVRGVSDSIFVLARHGADPVPYARAAPGATIVPDASPDAGPVEALRGAVRLTKAATVLVAPCDAPGLSPGLARHLVAACEEAGRPALAMDAAGALFSLFAAPRPLLAERLGSARRLEELTAGGVVVATDLAGLNVNESRPNTG